MYSFTYLDCLKKFTRVFTIHAIRKDGNTYRFLAEADDTNEKIWIGQKDFVDNIPDPNDLITFLLDKFPLFKLEHTFTEESKL